MTREEQVLIRGKVFLYKQKAPFVPSGKSVLGALEYREADDKVRCHECGEWKIALGQHLHKEHGVTAAEYKERHGLRQQSALCGIRFLEALSRTSKERGLGRNLGGMAEERRLEVQKIGRVKSAEVRAGLADRAERRASELKNERGTCQAQLLGKIREIAEKHGWSLTRQNLSEDGISYHSAMLALGVGSMAELRALAGMAPKRAYGESYRYTREMLVELLRAFSVKHGRPPSMVDIQKLKLLPSLDTFRRHFGSMSAAYHAAGINKKNEWRRGEKTTSSGHGSRDQAA